MMEFLDKIYGYEHFGIILFAVIAFLVILFLIVLFFGKKDEKKRELERTQQLAAQQATNTFAEVNKEPVPVDVVASAEPVTPVVPVEQGVAAPIMELVTNIEPIEPIADTISVIEPEITGTQVIEPEPIAPVLQPTVEPAIITPMEEVVPAASIEPTTPVVPVEPTIKEPIIEPVIKEEPIVNNEVPTEIEIPNFNFEELAASIANELNALENKTVEPVKEEISAPIVEPVREVVKPTPGPQIFSSVYINKPAEPAVPIEPVTPVEPIAQPNLNIELPKPAEMPILNKEVNNNPVAETVTSIPDFSQFEGESYDIK